MPALRVCLEVARWATGAWLLWRIPLVGTARSPLDDVAVIVPARNEEANLGRLLPSLAGTAAEVIVVDDGSTDGTAAVARAAGVRVVPAGEPPPGWAGKPWACAAGADLTAPGRRTLLFLDADTVVEPGGLERVVAEQRRRGGLVSVQPFHVTERPHERLAAFFNLVSMMGVGAFTPRSHARPRGAFGPCLAIDRATYDEVGGHRAVRDQVLEDVAFAANVAAAGAPVTVFGGRGAVRFRMYPEGPRQLVEGFSKNIAGGAGRTAPVTLALIVVWISGLLTAAWHLAVAPWSSGAGAATAVVVYAAYAAQMQWMLARIGRFGAATAVVYPVPLAAFLAVFASSAVRTAVLGEVRWRGRTIRTRPS